PGVGLDELLAFVEKTIKGEAYCYFQHIDGSGLRRQIYIGKKSPELKKFISSFKKEKKLILPDIQHIKQLSAQLRAGGAITSSAASAQVLKSLADSGVFKLGGTLVGTHAFAVMGNMLGVNWETHLTTQDIDVACSRQIDVAVLGNESAFKADIPTALEKLKMGFLPVPAFSMKDPSTSFKVRGQTLIVDVLTPAKNENDVKPVFLPRLNTAAQPLPFLDYLMEETEKGAVIAGESVLVNVPSPARFALHKLIVAGERSASMHGKINKDINQAADLLTVLNEERQGDILMAWSALCRRGKNWPALAKSALKKLERRHPAQYSALAKLLLKL
ncbi:MAG: GSU2403 family nucleotidyltransferase fold protein, partial [Elusimicrobia bacterium]|nr:GSU2403 family nucleotidyltransferase fold protein [Elusimicrobiota bacterium]